MTGGRLKPLLSQDREIVELKENGEMPRLVFAGITLQVQTTAVQCSVCAFGLRFCLGYQVERSQRPLVTLASTATSIVP